MKTILFLICLFTISTSFSQEGFLRITNLETQKERIIKEYKRIQITNNAHFKSRARFTIVSEHSLMIKGQLYKLADISTIRRSTQFDAIMTSVNMVWIDG